jgi:hypothetical protein
VDVNTKRSTCDAAASSQQIECALYIDADKVRRSMGRYVRLVQGSGMNNRLCPKVANRPVHQFPVGDSADDLRMARWHEIQTNDLVPFSEQPRYQGLPQPTRRACNQNAQGQLLFSGISQVFLIDGSLPGSAS